MIYLQILIFSIGMLSLTCSKNENNQADNHENDSLIDTSDDSIELLIFDTIQGSWNWYATYDAKNGIIENDYNVVIKFLHLNEDSTIVYETYKNDTLVKNGNLRIINCSWGRKIIPNIVPYYIATNETYFKFKSIDTLEIFEYCDDCPIYYYSK